MMMMMIIFTKIALSAVKNEYLKYVLFLLPCEIWTWPCMFIILRIQSMIQCGSNLTYAQIPCFWERVKSGASTK